MKRFDIITEADARVLSRGETIVLARHGHITPLAQDTLAERRIIVVREGASSDEEMALAPTGDIRSVAIGCDHTGIQLRRGLAAFLRGRGLRVVDLGTDLQEPTDYPDIAALVARTVAAGEVDVGILVDGSGIGSAIAANKIDGIRAAMATSETIARYSREHNGANVLTLGATLLNAEEAKAIVATWMATPMLEPRYIRRLAKIRDLERREP